MNRDNVLERHLLSRSYSSEAEIHQLLASRYSITGEQKPVVVLTATGKESEVKNTKSLLHDETDKVRDGNYKGRKRRTRLDLKEYIERVLKNQKKVVKKIQAYNRTGRGGGTNSNTKLRKPFPTVKLLEHYGIPFYQEFEPMNQLWQEYMQNLLFSAGSTDLPSLGSVLPKLASADFNGCLMRVLEARNPLLVGIEGIVVWDTQHSFILCVARKQGSSEDHIATPTEQIGGFRVVPKKNTLFAFDVVIPQRFGVVDGLSDGLSDILPGGAPTRCIGFTIIGSRFEFRSVDRSGRKFKNHGVDDII